jgi:CBS domain-containing protein
MNDEIIDDELSQMYEEESKTKKTLDSSTLHKPVKHLRVRKPITLGPHDMALEAIELMRKKKIGCVLVTEQEKLVGIFTERDVLMKVAGRKDISALKLSDVMTKNVDGFQQDDSIAYVLNAMHVGGYRHIPVIDEKGKPIAVISVKDIIAYILEHFAEDILNLPPSPMRKTEQREGA